MGPGVAELQTLKSQWNLQWDLASLSYKPLEDLGNLQWDLASLHYLCRNGKVLLSSGRLSQLIVAQRTQANERIAFLAALSRSLTPGT